MRNKLIRLLKKIPFFTEIKSFVYRTLKPKFLFFLSGSIKPISSIYGIERGSPIDRFYIENFLKENQPCIKGACLEILDNEYTTKYGADNITKSDILDINKNNTKATIFGDLRNLKDVIPDNTYDCIILTQVLQFIDDYNSAVLECKRILKKGGCLLITAPSMSRIDCASGINNDFWRFTEASFNYILKDKFDYVKISSFGNVKTGMGFWIGLSQSDISERYYSKNDKNFPIVITAAAKK